jgi:hypothetical protein
MVMFLTEREGVGGFVAWRRICVREGLSFFLRICSIPVYMIVALLLSAFYYISFFNFAKNIPYSFIYSTGLVEKKMAVYFANIYTSCIF